MQSVLYTSLERFIQVGTICCRLENKDDQNILYLMTMGILAVRPIYLLGFVDKLNIHLASLIALSFADFGLAESGTGASSGRDPHKAQDRQNLFACPSI